jgi:hypothetical protein
MRALREQVQNTIMGAANPAFMRGGMTDAEFRDKIRKAIGE